MKVARRQKLGDGLAVRLVRLPMPVGRGVDVQRLQAHAVGRERVGDYAALDVVVVALARHGALEPPRAAQRRL